MENKVIESKNKLENETSSEHESNQVPYWTQRVSSGIIDVGLLLFLFYIFATLFQLTPLGTIATSYKHEAVYIEKDYALKPLIEGSDETYCYKVYLDDSNKDTYINYYHFDDEGDDKTYVLVPSENKEMLPQLESAYQSALKVDSKYKAANFNYRLVNYGINMLAVASGEAILILMVPLINKRRVTIGQYLGGLRCLNNKVPMPAYWYKIVIRYFWVVVVEIALPWLSFLQIYSIIVIPIILYVISLFNKNQRTLRDYVTSTRFIDNKSYQSLSGK